MKYYFTKKTKIGLLTIVQLGEGVNEGVNEEVIGVKFGSRIDGEEKLTPLIEEAFKQLDEYFEGKRKAFNLPLLPHGTEFQKKVWTELAKIPYGETRTYKDIAVSIGNSKACRAVGMANNKNPIPIIIPCHRVIGTNGKLTGYAGGVRVKEMLLAIEKLTLIESGSSPKLYELTGK